MIGYKELLTKKSGMISAWPMPMNLSLVFIKDAIRIEMAANPPETKNIIKIAIMKYRGLNRKSTPISMATGIIIKTWKIALTPEATDLPITVAYLEAGATRSFFKIPVSLSHTIVKP